MCRACKELLLQLPHKATGPMQSVTCAQPSNIDPSDLARLLHGGGLRKFLIVDCRSFLDYNDKHIVNAVNAFYSKLVRRRLQENKVCASELLTQFLTGECGGKQACAMSSEGSWSPNEQEATDVILYDQQATLPSKDPRLSDNAPANLSFNGVTEKSNGKRRLSKSQSMVTQLDDSDSFIQLLVSKLQSSAQFRRIITLKGGFLDFESKYPELCEGVSPRQTTAVDGPAPMPVVNRMSLTSLSQPCLGLSNQGPTKILPFLYLGSQQDAMDQQTLKKHGISRVINLSVNCPRPDHLTDGDSFLRVPVNDSYQEKLLPYFEPAFAFIDLAREQDRVVLIHCLAGISRSPTLAIAYVMRHLRMTSEEAYAHVKSKRPSVSPNFNFMGQLLQFEENQKHTLAQRLADQLRSSSRKLLIPPNRLLLAATEKDGTSVIHCPKTSPIVHTDRTVDANNFPMFPFQTKDEAPDAQNNSATKESAISELMRRSFSCPLEVDTAFESTDLTRVWQELDKQSPSSKTNLNGKRQMRLKKSPTKTPIRDVNSSQNGCNSAAVTSDTVHTSKMHQPGEVSRANVVEGAQKSVSVKLRRVALTIPVSVNQDLPSPTSELSKLSFTPSSASTDDGDALTDLLTTTQPKQREQQNTRVGVPNGMHESQKLKAFYDRSADSSLRISSSSSPTSRESITSGTTSRSCSTEESFSDDQPVTLPTATGVQSQCSVDSVAPSSALINPFFESSVTPSRRFGFLPTSLSRCPPTASWSARTPAPLHSKTTPPALTLSEIDSPGSAESGCFVESPLNGDSLCAETTSRPSCVCQHEGDSQNGLTSTAETAVG